MSTVTKSQWPSFLSFEAYDDPTDRSRTEQASQGRAVVRSLMISLLVAVPLASSAHATPAHDARVAALRATLARAGITLETRSVYAVSVMARCNDVVDRLQPRACARCILADDREVPDEVLAMLSAELERYPTDLLAQADIRTFDLCRRIDELAGPRLGGAADTDQRHLLMDVFDPAPQAIMHHELFHMIESARIADIYQHDEQWERSNSVGFSYDAVDKLHETEPGRPDGFVNWYSTTNAVEDRASVFEYMMAKPDELCTIAASDSIVRDKAQTIWNRIFTYAKGGDLMYGTAPCVHSVAGR